MDEANNFPLAAPVVMSDCYMDGILSGSESIQEVIELQHQLIEMFKTAGMHLHKWCGNLSEMTSKSIGITAVPFWSDSTIVISWIHQESRELKTFVANRVSKIHQLSSRDQWHHIASERILQMCYLEDYFLRSFVTTLYGGMVLTFFYRVLIQPLSLRNQPREMTLTVN
ncbi:integrase catalytic domain-containing protein [Trichonephila clavipes]|nr:integrase catalytic domain-containing protein [Trichonephila clavipes]